MLSSNDEESDQTREPSLRLRMLLARHRAFQLGFLVAGLVASIQLTLDRVDLVLLIGEGFASMVNEYGHSLAFRYACLSLRNLAIEVEPALLQRGCRPFAIWRILRRIRARPGCFWTDRLSIARCPLAVSRANENCGDCDCE